MLSGAVWSRWVESSTALGGFRVLKKTLEAPYATKVNCRDWTSRGTTLRHHQKRKDTARSSSTATAGMFSGRGAASAGIYRREEYTTSGGRLRGLEKGVEEATPSGSDRARDRSQRTCVKDDEGRKLACYTNRAVTRLPPGEMTNP